MLRVQSRLCCKDRLSVQNAVVGQLLPPRTSRLLWGHSPRHAGPWGPRAGCGHAVRAGRCFPTHGTVEMLFTL